MEDTWFCAQMIDKEEEYLNVGVAFDPYLLFGGTFEPAVMLKIVSIIHSSHVRRPG